MNDDLILRARLDAMGYSAEQIEKEFSLNPKNWGAGSAGDKFTDRLPGGQTRLSNRTGQTNQTINNNKKLDVATGQEDATAAYEAKRAGQGKETVLNTPTAMTDTNLTMDVRSQTGEGPSGERNITPEKAIQGSSGQSATVGGDGSVTGTAAIPDVVETKQKTELGPDGNATNTTTTVDENINSNETGDSGTTPATGMDATGATTPTTQDPQQATQQPAQQQQQGGGGVNAQVQGMAQQFQAGQDMESIQQGKGADKKSWLKDRSLGGKAMDIFSLGASKGLGSTGSGARNKANAASAQQTQNFQGANQRMNQRAMGMNAQMPVQTSFDSQLSAYSDIISIRKGIQERNTTHNLRR